MQDTWITCKTEEIQGCIDRNEWMDSFVAIKAIYGPQPKELSIFSPSTAVPYSLRRRKPLKVGLITVRRPQPSLHCIDAAIDQLHQVENSAELDPSPSLHETIGTVQQLSRGKLLDRTRSLL
ncbi:hypothetical protein SprV_0502013700 [Sparganum proliferum]